MKINSHRILLSPAGQSGGGGFKVSFSESDFARLRSLLSGKMGLREKYLNSRREAVSEYITERCTELRMEPRRYIERLRLDVCDPELQGLLVRVLNGETSFFRNADQLQSMCDSIVSTDRDFPLSIWCAGCSTGQEPYSIAMMLRSDPRLADRPFSILATDVSGRSIQFAREGLYPALSLKRIGEDRHRRLFGIFTEKSGDKYRIKNEIRRFVTFMSHNLNNDPFGAFSVILCRNVFIYLEEASQRRIIDKFYQSLPPGGYLFLGYAESLVGLDARFIALAGSSPLHYRKPFPDMEMEVKRARVRQPGEAQPKKVPDKGADRRIELFARAEKLFEQKKYDGVMRLCQRILSEDGNSARARYLMGRVHAQRAAYGSALDEFRTSTALDELFADAHFWKGFIHFTVGDFVDAVKSFDNALLLESDLVMARFFKAMTLHAAGELARALQEFRVTHDAMKSHTGPLMKFDEGFPRKHYMDMTERYIADIKEAMNTEE